MPIVQKKLALTSVLVITCAKVLAPNVVNVQIFFVKKQYVWTNAKVITIAGFLVLYVESVYISGWMIQNTRINVKDTILAKILAPSVVDAQDKSVTVPKKTSVAIVAILGSIPTYAQTFA